MPQRPDSHTGSTASAAQPIIEVALSLFAENGFDRVSMRQIAEQAGVSKANLYHHFQNKEALYLAAMRSAVESGHWLICEAARSEESLPVRLTQFMSAQLQLMLDDPAPHRMVLREVLDGSASDREALATGVVGGFYRDLLEVLLREREAGNLAPGLNPDDVAAMIASSTLMYFQFHSVMQFVEGSGFERSPAEYSERMITLILQGAHTGKPS